MIVLIFYTQDYILSQDPFGDMTSTKWEDHVFELSRAIEPRDAPPKKAVCLINVVYAEFVCLAANLIMQPKLTNIIFKVYHVNALLRFWISAWKSLCTQGRSQRGAKGANAPTFFPENAGSVPAAAYWLATKQKPY